MCIYIENKMSGQIKRGKCSVVFDKEPCSTINDYYRTCQSCRDKINSRCGKRKNQLTKPAGGR